MTKSCRIEATGLTLQLLAHTAGSSKQQAKLALLSDRNIQTTLALRNGHQFKLEYFLKVFCQYQR